MTARRGITLIELLVAMVLFVIVATLAMMVFSNQNRSFKMEAERAEAALMVKGTLDELTRAVRMTGGSLPEESAGIQVWNSTAESTTFVINERGGQDTVTGFVYDSAAKRIHLKISDASRFSDSGFVVIPLIVAPSATSQAYTAPILQRMTGLCGDSLVLDATPLAPVGPITSNSNTLIYNLDSLTFRKRNDTLFVRRNRKAHTAFAVGVDTLRFRYWHPEAGWKPGLWAGANPDLNNRIDKVEIRLVVRNLTYDPKRFQQDRNSRGYTFAVLETEVSLRNAGLVHK